MKSTSVHVLQRLYQQASEVYDSTVQKLGLAMQTLHEEQAKLSMLNDYRRDYVVNLNTLMSRGVSKLQHQNYQHFLVKLDQAIRGQEEMLVMANYRLETQQDILQEAMRKKKSFEVLLDRRIQQQHQQSVKREQKMMDEFASRSRRSVLL